MADVRLSADITELAELGRYVYDHPLGLYLWATVHAACAPVASDHTSLLVMWGKNADVDRD